MNKRLFHKLAKMAMADNAKLEEGEEPRNPEDVYCEGFDIVDDGNYPKYWRCRVEYICFVGEFCMFVAGNGCWLFGEDGETIHAVRNVREIFAKMDSEN